MLLGTIAALSCVLIVTSACAAKFKIEFYDDTNIVEALSTYGNETIQLPEAPAKSGFVFVGWYFDKGTWKDRLTEETYKNTQLKENVKVYAYYKSDSEQTFTVTFETNGGSAVQSVTTDVIEEEPQTTYEGHDFAGWYTDSNFTDRVTFPYTVTQNITLYAKWTEKIVTPVFEVSSAGELTAVSNTDGLDTIVIPEYVNGVKVVKLANYLFRYNTDLKSLTIPDSVTYIGLELCVGCRNLENVNIPAGLSVIPTGMFRDCPNLSSVQLPYGLAAISADAFMNTAVIEIVLPDTVVIIGQFAFA